MAWRNSEVGYGAFTRLIHWLMALSIIGMLIFGTIIARMRFTLDNLWVYQVHKSIGLTLLILVVLRLIWHRVSPPPGHLPMPKLQALAARSVHIALYLLMLAVPLTGWIASAASGIDTVFWGMTVPGIAPVSEAWENGFFKAHDLLTKAMIGLLVLHIAGALTHGIAIKRMITGTST